MMFDCKGRHSKTNYASVLFWRQLKLEWMEDDVAIFSIDLMQQKKKILILPLRFYVVEHILIKYLIVSSSFK